MSDFVRTGGGNGSERAKLAQADEGHRPEPLTFAEAVHEIRDKLNQLQNAPHEEFEGHGGLCPICGLTTSLLAKLEDWRDD